MQKRRKGEKGEKRRKRKGGKEDQSAAPILRQFIQGGGVWNEYDPISIRTIIKRGRGEKESGERATKLPRTPTALGSRIT